MADGPDPSAGVFETLLVGDGRVQSLERHLARLAASAGVLYATRLPETLTDDVRARVEDLRGAHRLRIDAVPDGDRLAIGFTTSPIDSARPRHHVLRALTFPDGHGAHKWRDRRILQLPRSDPRVPLLLDGDGRLLEAAWANVWTLDGDRLATPPADGRILPGITRARLLELAPSLGLIVKERTITLAQARAAPALLLTSSLALVATATLDDRPPSRDARVTEMREALAGGEWS